ncbi:MAG: NUDIX hydrolase [Anaerolineae bacterium]|nr:NUDIX hydrolase [Anaerolineae bacterium]
MKQTQLKELLLAGGLDLTLWGRDHAKSVADLWQEIAAGEARLQTKPLLRLVSVVQVIIRRKGRVLLEIEQEFDDGRRRLRRQPPADKMKPAETYAEAARRCLAEELGVDRANVTILESTYQQTKKITDSPSYPGLRTRYVFHQVEARVPGLPDTDFWTDEIASNKQDPVKRHHWAWQPDS